MLGPCLARWGPESGLVNMCGSQDMSASACAGAGMKPGQIVSTPEPRRIDLGRTQVSMRPAYLGALLHCAKATNFLRRLAHRLFC